MWPSSQSLAYDLGDRRTLGALQQSDDLPAWWPARILTRFGISAAVAAGPALAGHCASWSPCWPPPVRIRWPAAPASVTNQRGCQCPSPVSRQERFTPCAGWRRPLGSQPCAIILGAGPSSLPHRAAPLGSGMARLSGALGPALRMMVCSVGGFRQTGGPVSIWWRLAESSGTVRLLKALSASER